MTKGWPSSSCSFWASGRITRSLGPPAVKAITMRTGVAGNSWALAASGASNAATARKRARKAGMRGLLRAQPRGDDDFFHGLDEAAQDLVVLVRRRGRRLEGDRGHLLFHLR